jgi:hypothetical protein
MRSLLTQGAGAAVRESLAAQAVPLVLAELADRAAAASAVSSVPAAAWDAAELRAGRLPTSLVRLMLATADPAACLGLSVFCAGAVSVALPAGSPSVCHFVVFPWPFHVSSRPHAQAGSLFVAALALPPSPVSQALLDPLVAVHGGRSPLAFMAAVWTQSGAAQRLLGGAAC